ncbi:hypothetical protein PCL_11309 [Purpureocillium lilacinum]|uniref:Uncharacterized protein n=1 Tax=Purpureocillium lilacinum TaxID=33203 RepID=A0A2U3DPU1_PURLI|nr:hypothetical protein PCL_11309 [Purpureocillium lilacinum]
MKEPTRSNKDIVSQKKRLRTLSKRKLLAAIASQKRANGSQKRASDSHSTNSRRVKRLKGVTTGGQSLPVGEAKDHGGALLAPPNFCEVAEPSTTGTQRGAYQPLDQAPIWPDISYGTNQNAISNPMYTPLWPQSHIPANDLATILDPTGGVMPELDRTSIPDQAIQQLFTVRPSRFVDHNSLESTDEGPRPYVPVSPNRMRL